MTTRKSRSSWMSWLPRWVAPVAVGLGCLGGGFDLPLACGQDPTPPLPQDPPTIPDTPPASQDAPAPQDAPPADAAGPQTIRDSFEGPTKVWHQEKTDAAIEIYTHERTQRAAHDGKQSEGFEFKAGIGGGLYYSYPVPKIPITGDLAATMYVRSNRVGMQFLARVILPSDVDPDSQRPSFVLIPSTSYEAVDRWQKIELDDMMPAIERQARVLRAASKRKVSLEGAYLERLVVNIYGGEGQTEVYLDELTIGPVAAEIADAHARLLRGEPMGNRRATVVGAQEDLPAARRRTDPARSAAGSVRSNIPSAADRIKFERNRLTKDGYPWFPTMIRAFDTDPTLIRQLGSDIAVVPVDANADYLDLAIRSGLLLMPELAGDSDPDPVTGLRQSRPVDPDKLLASAENFAAKEHVFAWSLGNDLGEDLDIASRKLQNRNVRDALLAIRKEKPGGSPYSTGMVLGMLPEYARIPENLDMIGIPAQTWATPRGPFELLRYLEQRRLLVARGNADALIWSEVDVTAPPIYKRMIWGVDRPPEGGNPVVQPEQIRLAVYHALAAGCRGIDFRAQGELMQGVGRMSSIEMAILNEEIDLLEPIIADPDRSISLVNVYMAEPAPQLPQSFLQTGAATLQKTPIIKEQPANGSLKAAAIATKDRRGVLLMVADFSPYAQYQPTQAALNKIRVRVPAADDAIAYMISPGGVKPLNSVRVPGGHDITLDDFGTTAIILMTTNADLKDQIEQAVNRVRPFAIDLAIEQAILQRNWVAQVDYKLRLDGHPQRDWNDLLLAADKLIKSAQDALAREDYPTAWDEARRVGRPLRILMREHFMATYDAIVKALKDPDLPCGPVMYSGQKKPQPRVIGPMVAAPLASFNTLPQAWQWLDWMKTGRLGRNALPSGEFDYKSRDEFFDAGWSSERYEVDDLTPKVSFTKGGMSRTHEDAEEGSYLSLRVGPTKGIRLDSLVPFTDHPTVAVRSPGISVRAGEMYRISVLANMANSTAPGNGGLIVRDSMGGERFQFRTHDGLPDAWFEIVYYRRIPVDGELNITLGLAAVAGVAAFDDLRVEPIVEQLTPEQIQQAAAVRPRAVVEGTTRTVNTGTPDPDTTAKPIERPTRSATRSLPMPIRE